MIKLFCDFNWDIFVFLVILCALSFIIVTHYGSERQVMTTILATTEISNCGINVTGISSHQEINK